MPDEFDPDEKITIKIGKDNGKSDTAIEGAINGQAFKVAVGQEVEVPAAVAMAIAHSGITYEVVGDGVDGLPAASTAPKTDTATRETPAEDPLAQKGEGAPPIPTLEGGDGDTGIGAATAMDAGKAPDLLQGESNAEGQGVAAQGGPRVGNDDSALTGAQGDDGKPVDNAEGHGDAAASDAKGDAPAAPADASSETGEAKPDEVDKPADEQPAAAAADGETVDQLKARIASINDLSELHAERDAEVAAKNRITALGAIDERIGEVESAS